MISKIVKQDSDTAYIIPATIKEGFPFLVEDYKMIESGKSLDDIIAAHQRETGISTPVQIIRNAKRHRWEVYLIEGDKV